MTEDELRECVEELKQASGTILNWRALAGYSDLFGKAVDIIEKLSEQNQQLKNLIINTLEDEWNGTWKVENYRNSPKMIRYFGGYATVEDALEDWLEEND